VRTAARLLPGAAVVLVAACGSVTEDPGGLGDALVVDLPGYVSAAPRPTPETLCDGNPTGGGPPPPALPQDLGIPAAAAFYETAPATLEAYAWRASPEEAEQVVEDATAASSACDVELFTDADTDGDGEFDTGISEVQRAEPWSGSGWEGVRIHRVVEGREQVDRRLVHSDDVVLLVVLRADTDEESDTSVVDDYLENVAEKLG
jgi:hypothetical protein